MPHSFVWLYLFKCDVCTLNHICINSKRFLIILYVFGSDFYHSLYSCLVLTLFFHCLNMFCFEKQVLEFLATHFGYLRELPVLATHFGDLQAASLSPEFTQKGFATQLATRQSRNTQNQLFKEFFRGKLVLNLSHPLLNPAFNIFSSKPNQFELFFIPLTSLR